MDKGEVFTKADLPKVKGKVKKRELCGGSKVKSKPSAKRQKDSQPSLSRTRQQQLINQENRMVGVPVVGLGKPRLSRPAAANGSLGRLHSSKVKVSDTVTSRKILGGLKSNTTSGSKLQFDLQRVLGKNVSSSPPTQSKVTVDHKGALDSSRMDVVCPSTPSLSTLHQHHHQQQLQHSSGPSPAPTPDIPLVDISQRLVQGLQVEVFFPHSTYLTNIKAELKKVLKQSNPSGYEELIGYFSASEPALGSPFINHLQQTMLPAESSAEVAPTLLPLASKAGQPISSDPSPTACTTVGGAGGIVGGASAGVSDTVALNLEVNTSALNINDPTSSSTSSASPPPLGHTPPRPRDFLDLVDSAATSAHHHHCATPPEWEPMPMRPRMFPHKLY